MIILNEETDIILNEETLLSRQVVELEFKLCQSCSRTHQHRPHQLGNAS